MNLSRLLLRTEQADGIKHYDGVRLLFHFLGQHVYMIQAYTAVRGADAKKKSLKCVLMKMISRPTSIERRWCRCDGRRTSGYCAAPRVTDMVSNPAVNRKK